VSQISTALAYVVLVRGMPKADFGVFSLLYSFIPVLATVGSLGLEQVLRRYQPEYLRSGNVAGALSLVRFVASARFGLNLVLIGLVLLAWNHLAPVFHLGPYRVQFAYFSVLLLLHFQSQILMLSLASHMMHRYSVGSIAVLSIGKLVGYCAMLYFGAFSLAHAIFADTAAYALVFVFLRTVYRRHCVADSPPDRYRMPAAERRRMFQYGFFNNFNDAGTLLMGSATDNFFIAAFIDPISVGIYAFYSRLNDMATNLLPGQLFDNIIQPLFFSIKSGEAHYRLRQSFTFLLNTNLILLWPMLAYATVYHAEIVQVIFGGKFVEQSWLLPLIIFFSTINSIGAPVGLVAKYEEKASIMLLSKIFVVYNLAAMVLLLPKFGIYGAMLARGSAEVFKNFFIWWWVRRTAIWTNFRALMISALLLWGTVTTVCYLVKTTVPAPAILQLFFGALICSSGVLIYVRTPAMASTDRQMLASVFHGKEARILRFFGLIKPDTLPAPGA
jgi:O-antigen/teichoic acid export membrane protein